MIVSHRHELIFIKTQKTAGTAMEVALSGLCGPDDIITPIQSWIEGERAQAAGRGAQNFRIAHPAKPQRPLVKRLLGRPERLYHPSVGYYDHMPAWRVKTYLGDDIWSRYFKIAFERNPWDRQVSWYRYKTKSRPADKTPTFEAFLADRRRAFVDNFDLYAIDGTVAVDFIGRYEHVAEDFASALTAAGITEAPGLPQVNVSAGGRVDYRRHYTDETRELVADWYRREIEVFGYEFWGNCDLDIVWGKLAVTVHTNCRVAAC